MRDRRIVESLLNLGAHRNVKDFAGKTCMDRAEANWDLKMGMLLRNAGCQYDMSAWNEWANALDKYDEDHVGMIVDSDDEDW